MALSDWQFCSPAALITPIKNGDSWSVLVDGKIACSMSSGGAHRFRLRSEAEHFGNCLKRGYVVGTYLSIELENYIQ
tara:strand:- start:11911 stop:12141 length:231 start_codon:yes stop_codon:yes gene_type:complete